MARSPLTLAAAVTSIGADTTVIAAAELTERSAGRIDAAHLTLDDGRTLVVRVGTDADSGDELRAQARALRALSSGMRALLPFAVPEVLGEVPLGSDTAYVTTFIAGYRVDPGQVPPGAGVATSIAAALAAIHALPVASVRDAGLAVRTSAQIRDETERLIDRVQTTKRAPVALVSRWRRAVDTDDLWRFEPTVILGSASSDSFFLADRDDLPVVTGVAHWEGLSVGDPAADLQWIASAPTAASDVLAAYAAGSDRAPDPFLRSRARLHAELEFARWLVHGYDANDATVMTDAETLLSSLADSVVDDALIPRASAGVDDAIALMGQMPSAATSGADTSMHTDAYDPDELATWITDEPADTVTEEARTEPVSTVDEPSPGNDNTGTDEEPSAGVTVTDAVTAPILLPVKPVQLGTVDSSFGDIDPESDEPARAARAAFQRWTSSSSE
ncbi:hypothetical protein GCM10009808_04360 [Microbacterium sediminicola]|uniref:Aminoglycoside phosphotransferase domain-containing protein n=1 Tax=Microbacterium sediminicola TaxID=415210 RepID=A0ABN2HN03_9MICO